MSIFFQIIKIISVLILNGTFRRGYILAKQLSYSSANALKRVADGTASSTAATLGKYLVFNQDPKLASLQCVKLIRLPSSFHAQGKTRGTGSRYR
jgi:hypothetical protein